MYLLYLFKKTEQFDLMILLNLKVFINRKAYFRFWTFSAKRTDS